MGEVERRTRSKERDGENSTRNASRRAIPNATRSAGVVRVSFSSLFCDTVRRAIRIVILLSPGGRVFLRERKAVILLSPGGRARVCRHTPPGERRLLEPRASGAGRIWQRHRRLHPSHRRRRRPRRQRRWQPTSPRGTPAPPPPRPPGPLGAPGPWSWRSARGVLHGAQVARGRAVEVAWAADERRLLDARGWTVLLGVAVPTVGAVDAETELVHVAVLDVLQGVLEGTVGLPALVILGEESARGHARLVELMQEAAVVALHAQATEPVAAHRLGGEGGTGGSIHGLGWRCGDGGTARGGRASDLAP